MKTGTNFWRMKLDLKNTIPTDYIGRALGQVTLAACKETIKTFVKGEHGAIEYSHSREQFNRIALTLSQVLSCIDPNLAIYEIGTVRVSLQANVSLTVVGCTVVKSTVNEEFVYVHLHCLKITDSVLLDVISRMKIFGCSKSILTVLSSDESNLQILRLDECLLVDEIWNLIQQISFEVFQSKTLPTKLSEKTKELRDKLKTGNLNEKLTNITEIPLLTSAEVCSDPSSDHSQSIYFNPVQTIQTQTNLHDEIDKFAERAKQAVTEATLLCRPLASQLLLFSVNNLAGRTSKSDREDLPTHYARCGKGTRIKEDVRPMINEAIKDIETMTNCKVRSFSADTAYHHLVDFKENGDTKNIISLQYSVYNKCKANKVINNLEIIKESFDGKQLKELNVPFTWTFIADSHIVPPPPDTRFPNLGDNTVVKEMFLLNLPKASLVEDEDTNIEEDDETIVDDPEETILSYLVFPSLPTLPVSVALPKTRKTKSSSVPTLIELAESCLLKMKDLLCTCASILLFRSAYEKFAEEAPISKNLLLPGLETPLDIIAVPEVSPHGGHLRASFIDTIHSATRLRANCSSRNILGGKLHCYKFVAKEGMTQLKISHVIDRVDMMNEDMARIMFSIQVEARLRNLSLQFQAEDDKSNEEDFLATANSCRLVRLYIEANMAPGIPSFERLSCLSYIILTLRSQYNPFHFPPG